MGTARHRARHRTKLAKMGISRQTFVYTFVSNYLVFVGLFLVMWMAFCPFLSLRRAPARALNWFSRTIRLTERFRFTGVLMCLALIAAGTEYLSMQSKQNSYLDCKAKGTSTDNCQSYLAQKWRGERNFWLMAFNFFSWFIVDILSKQAKTEEDFHGFLAEQNATESFNEYVNDHQRQEAAAKAAQNKSD